MALCTPRYCLDEPSDTSLPLATLMELPLFVKPFDANLEGDPFIWAKIKFVSCCERSPTLSPKTACPFLSIPPYGPCSSL